MMAELPGEDEVTDDPILKALERSTIHQTLKAARASLAQPSRPFTPLDRSLFQMPNTSGENRPSSALVDARRTSSAGGSPRHWRSFALSPEPVLEEEPEHEATGSSDAGIQRSEWEVECEAVIASLQTSAMSKKKKATVPAELPARAWELVSDIQAGRGTKPHEYARKLLGAIGGVLGQMDFEDAAAATSVLRLSKCALVLLQVEGSGNGVQTWGVQEAYLNVVKVLFKCSKVGGSHDAGFRNDGLIELLLQVLESKAPDCTSNDLRVLVVGVLKNVSQQDEANQSFLMERGVVDLLFALMSSDSLTGGAKEAQLLIQITAALRNLASHQYKPFLAEEKLHSLTRAMALFPSEAELLTNISRILAKLTLHSSPCEALGKSNAHVEQMAQTLGANPDTMPLVLRLSFVLGNLTAKSDRLRTVYALGCQGTSLTPQLLVKYWERDKRLHEAASGKAGDQVTAPTKEMKDTEEVLVKLVRLVANMAINASVGSTLAASSAVVNPLLEMLRMKNLSDSEELVLNVVAAITNLLFYDEPSNILFLEENKRLLCELFQPLLLSSYNMEALVEIARALGNLSRHADARSAMAETSLRIDEILVILLDHDDRDLVFYVCGALVNFAADPNCTGRLVSVCSIAQKLVKLLRDAPLDDPALQLVAMKVLTNLSLDATVTWETNDVVAARDVLEELATAMAKPEGAEEATEAPSERQQMLDLSQHLLARLPVPAANARTEPKETRPFMCLFEGCGRKFETQEQLDAHNERRHKLLR